MSSPCKISYLIMNMNCQFIWYPLCLDQWYSDVCVCIFRILMIFEMNVVPIMCFLYIKNLWVKQFFKWLFSSVGRALDSKSKGHRFNSGNGHKKKVLHSSINHNDAYCVYTNQRPSLPETYNLFLQDCIKQPGQSIGICRMITRKLEQTSQYTKTRISSKYTGQQGVA